MNEEFEEYLKSNHVDEDALLEALRIYLSEQTDYKPDEEMEVELREHALSASELDNVRERFARDRPSLLGAAHITLGAVWYNADQRELVKQSISSAKQMLPLIREATTALIAIYALYLLATGGVQEHTKTTAWADGSIVTEHTVYEPPTSPLQAVVQLFRPGDPAH